MDGIEPALLERAEHALEHVARIETVERVRLRWVGHRLHGDAVVRTSALSLAEADQVAEEAENALRRHLPTLDEVTVRVAATGPA